MVRRSAVAAAFMSLAFATGAMAAGPFRIADAGPEALAIQDLGSKTAVSDHVVRVWETQLFEQRQSGPAAYDERRTLREFDCERRALRTKDVVYYRSGQRVAQADAGWSAWKTVAPEADGELSLLTACCPHPEAAAVYRSMDELKEIAWGRRGGPAS